VKHAAGEKGAFVGDVWVYGSRPTDIIAGKCSREGFSRSPLPQQGRVGFVREKAGGSE